MTFMDRRTVGFRVVLAAAIGLLAATASPGPRVDRNARPSATATVDNTTYVDANRILMFVTNHGNFGRDLTGYFGYDYGTFYPFSTVNDINTGIRTSSVIYAGGLWLGGVDAGTNDTLVTVSEYSSEYVPGPMSGGTYQSDRPAFRVYKLYRDSLAANPNLDYLEWPTDQGAPVDGSGYPDIRGDQLTWTVFNDANPNQHDNNNGETAPMGIEVQQTVWAVDQAGSMEIPLGGALAVTGPSESPIAVTATGVTPQLMNNHEYMVVTDSTVADGFIWHLIDLTLDDTVLYAQTDFDGTPVEVDGLRVTVTIQSLFASFEMVANGAGVLDPPEPAAAVWANFPVPDGPNGDGRPTVNQQVGDGMWFLHTGDNGGTSGGGTFGDYQSFIDRTFRGGDPDRIARLGAYDWEMRFTGSNDNPGAGGSYAWEAFDDGSAYWVPFELWRTGINTPDDPSDDVRLIPYIIGDWTVSGDGNAFFDLSQYGSSVNGTCHDACEHSVSSADNDPYTDRVYWCVPVDDSPGEAGYQTFETAMLTDPVNYEFEMNETRVMDRIVLVNWNGGEEPPFTQDLPEQGTVFRMTTVKPVSGLEFTFQAIPYDVVTSGPLGTSIFLKYKIINKGSKTFNDFFMSLWLDPDLGTAGDDLVGCDTLTNTFYCYNSTDPDVQFAGPVPAVGIKVLEGPVVQSQGDTAYVDGELWPGYRNLGMFSCCMYFNGTDPDNYAESYHYMWGLRAKESGAPPYIYNGDTLRYMFTGDPVTGQGDLDFAPEDRRIMASFGPFPFAPGDEQYALFKLAVGQGADRLSSITSMREVLAYEPIPTDVDDDPVDLLPNEFSVEQNYPNPFNPVTTISYSLPERAEVEIAVFNVLGQRVATLKEGVRPAGDYTVIWDGTDDAGGPVATGIYLYRVRAGDEMQTKKMLLLK